MHRRVAGRCTLTPGFAARRVTWLGATRLQVGATCLGRAERAFNHAVEFAAQREQFGQPIGRFQGTLSKFRAPDLGAVAIREALAMSGKRNFTLASLALALGFEDGVESTADEAPKVDLRGQYFAAAGLDPENPPETWDEFLEACAALEEAGIIPVICQAVLGGI